MTKAPNIIPFSITGGRSTNLPVIEVPACGAKTRPAPGARAICLATAQPHEGDEEMHAAAVVRASIRFARRKGVSLQSLPPILRLWLLRQCDRGDPACLMVREWLTGNRRFLAPAGINPESGE